MNYFKILPFSVLGVSVLITLLVWVNFLETQSDLQESKFIANSNFIKTSIVDRVGQYEQILYGARGLFVASTKVELDEWKSFVDSQNIDERFDGIQGVGHIRHISNDSQLDLLVDEMHKYGDNGFTVFPEGKRDEYYTIVYLEPLDFRNQRAIGYDIYSEKIRRNAVDTALSTNTITITGKIKLVQETETDIQNGFLMILPICDNVSDHTNSCDSSDLVFAVFRMNDFIGGILNDKDFKDTHLRIYDESFAENNNLFDSDSLYKHEFTKSDFSEFYNVSIGNRNWIFSFEGVKDLNPAEDTGIVLIPIVGFSMAFLLFYVLLLIGKNFRLTQDAIKNEKITAMGTMASRIAHDLRNPLSVLKMNIDLLQRKLENTIDDQSKEKFQRLDNSIKDINHIISDVLEFARTKEINFEQVSLNLILKDIFEQMTIPPTVKVSMLNTNINIFCDKSKISSVFMNLISNAKDAIESNGEIKISTKVDSKNTHVIFEDSGPGIKSDDIGKIFDPLFTSKKGGTGLGLPICKNIIEQHGGQIIVTNNPTRFTVVLPNRN